MVRVHVYHVLADFWESYIFPSDYIFPKWAAPRENISQEKKENNSLGTTKMCYFTYPNRYL